MSAHANAKAAAPHERATPSSPSLQHLFRQHVDAVWRCAVALGVAAVAADDVVQDVFMIAHRRLDTLDPERSPRSWLLGITRNVVRHHHRGSVRRAVRLQRVPEPDPVEAPHRELERREAADLVAAFVDQLDEKKRVVFVLGFIEGMSARNIAQTLGLKLPTVYARARAAEEALAKFARRHALRDGAKR